MSLKSRINESPSLRKLFRNRGAVIAMGIISLYLLLFVWILSMQFVGWIGNVTDSYDLRERPVMGALLPERTLERVGASNLPGFGIVAEPSKRTEQVKFYFEQVGKIFTELDQQQASHANGNGEETRTVEEIMAFSSLAERQVADRSIEELRPLYEDGMALFSQQDTLRGLRANLTQIKIAIEKLAVFRSQANDLSTLTEEEVEILYDELALTLDEIIELVGEYVDNTPNENDPLSLIQTDPLIEAMDALYDLEPMDSIYDQSVIDKIQTGIDSASSGIDNAVNAKLGEIEPILAQLYPIPSGLEGWIYKFRLMLGTDQQGRSIMLRALYSAKIAIQVGLIVSLIAVLFGSIIGAAAGYFGGFIDHVVIWLYSTFSSIPYLVLLVVLAFMFTGSIFEGTLVPLYVAFSLTYWIGPCRVTRGEALKLKALDYVQAAQALGASKSRILLKHIIPNTSHLMFINSSLLFIGAIKGEVVLTFLGLGLKNGASWGIMISQSKPEVVSGFFWQIGAATFFMFVLVLAFNVLTDALQDAFDPKHVG
jgi:ABC-type dipeptide/oligopeptide/nickel transport system permease subunit